MVVGRVTKPGGYIEVSDRRNGYDGEGPIFRKVSEACRYILISCFYCNYKIPNFHFLQMNIINCSLRVNRQDDSDFNYRISSHLSSNKFPILAERANIIFYLDL